MPPDADDVLSQGYQLHVKTSVCLESIDCVKEIVEKHNFMLKDEPERNLSVIYRPLGNQP